MQDDERRESIRNETLNLLDYVVRDKDGNVEEHSMGRTLNVSESGILLETHISLPTGSLLSITIGLEEDLVELQGRVVHGETAADGKFQSGITFVEIDAEGQRILNEYLKAFKDVYSQ